MIIDREICKLQSVDMVIAAAISDRLHLKWWICFSVTVSRVLAKCTGSSSVLNKNCKFEHRSTDCTPTLCGIFWIIYLLLSVTSTSFFGSVSQTFACIHSMAPSAYAFALRFQLSEYQHVPDPFTHSFFTFGTCLWTFKTLILVRSIKSSSNKQRRLCISWQTNNHAQQSFASATWWNKMEKVAELSLLTIN